MSFRTFSAISGHRLCHNCDSNWDLYVSQRVGGLAPRCPKVPLNGRAVIRLPGYKRFVACCCNWLLQFQFWIMRPALPFGSWHPFPFNPPPPFNVAAVHLVLVLLLVLLLLLLLLPVCNVLQVALAASFKCLVIYWMPLELSLFLHCCNCNCNCNRIVLSVCPEPKTLRLAQWLWALLTAKICLCPNQQSFSPNSHLHS